MKTFLSLLLLACSYTCISAQPLKNPYEHKKVLSIGARQTVLEGFSTELRQEGMDADWTDLCNDTAAIVLQYDARKYDVITFGRGVTDENKKVLKEKFLAQHPAIVFVEGLAPIPHLLVDQVKLALFPADQLRPAMNWSNEEVNISVPSTAQVMVKHYRLNWLFQAKEKILFDGKIGHEKTTIHFRKKNGRNFVVITCNGLAVAIQTI